MTLEEQLTFLLEENKKPNQKPKNILVRGNIGMGKTPRIVQWAEENNINLVRIPHHTSDILYYSEDGVIKPFKENGEKVRRYKATQLDELKKENSILLLENFDTVFTSSNERKTYYSILKDRKYTSDHGFVYDEEKGFVSKYFKGLDNELKEIKLEGLLFTIAEIHREQAEFPLTDEELEMFDIIYDI